VALGAQIKNSQCAGIVLEEEEYLPSKLDALISKSSTAQQKILKLTVDNMAK
jgi:hypothetical protein